MWKQWAQCDGTIKLEPLLLLFFLVNNSGLVTFVPVFQFLCIYLKVSPQTTSLTESTVDKVFNG